MIDLPSRRFFLRGALAVLAAPAVVRAASLMPVRALPNVSLRSVTAYQCLDQEISNIDVLYGSFNIDQIAAQYDAEFAVADAVIGSTLRVRLPNDYDVFDLTAHPVTR